MLDLGRAPALELGRVAVLAIASGVPEARRGLDAQLGLEGPQRRGLVQRPVAPRRARESVLEEHADDRQHRQAAVGQLRIQLFLPRLRGPIVHGGNRNAPEAEVALAAWSAR